MASTTPFGDPSTMALLGLAQGLLSAGSPSRMPVNIGGALAQGFGGALNNVAQAQQYANQDLRNTALKTSLEAQSRQQDAINSLAATLPADQQPLFLADPASYIKTLTGTTKLGPGEVLYRGSNQVASVPPLLHFQDTGSAVQPLNAQTGAPAGEAIPKGLAPGQAAGLTIQAANADPLGMFGLMNKISPYLNPSLRAGGQPTFTPASASTAAQPALHGEDFLSSKPKPIADQVKALAEGRMAFPAGFALKSPYWQNMISMVSQYDPNFDAVNYNSRAATRKDFTSGKSADNISALNTAIYHLGSLNQSLSSLNNSSIPAYNAVKNALGEQLGNEKIQSAKKAAEADSLAVAHELAKVFRSVGMSEKEVTDWQNKIGPNSTPAQRQAVIGEALHLMEGRLEALGERYNKGMGTTSDPFSFIDPKAKAVYDQLKAASSGQQQSGIKFLGFEK